MRITIIALLHHDIQSSLMIGPDALGFQLFDERESHDEGE